MIEPTRNVKPTNAHGIRSVGFWVCAAIACVVASGCGSPNVASITVRKQNQDLQDQVAELTRAREADAATIRALQEKQGGGLKTLPPDRLDKLFTVHGIKLGRLTGGSDLDAKTPGDEGLKIYATPTDDDGEPLKAAGTFTVEAFDLAAKTPELGKWEFDLAATRKSWINAALIHQFVLTCPWQQRPRHEEVTIKVTFRDELTGREFHEQRVVKVQPPAESPGTPAARSQ